MSNTGKILQVIGPVVDIRFDADFVRLKSFGSIMKV